MADETVKLIIDLENNAQKEFKKLNKELNKTKKEVDGLEKELSQNKKQLDNNSKSAKNAAKNFKNLDTSTSGVAANLGRIATVGAAVAAALGLVVQQSLQANKELTALSNIAGVNIQELQKLEFAYSGFGVTADDLSSTLKDLQERLNDARVNNAGEFVDFAKSLNLNLEELAKLDPVELLNRINSELSNLSEQDRISFADRLGSDAFVKIAQAASQAGGEIEGLQNRFEDLNLGIKETDSENLRKLSTEFSVLGKTFSSLTTETLATFAETLTGLLRRINEEIEKIRKGENEVFNFASAVGEAAVVTAQLAEARDNLAELKRELVAVQGGVFGEGTAGTQEEQAAAQKKVNEAQSIYNELLDKNSLILQKRDLIVKESLDADEQQALRLINLLLEEEASRTQIFNEQQKLSKQFRDDVRLQESLGAFYIRNNRAQEAATEEKKKQNQESTKEQETLKQTEKIVKEVIAITPKLSDAFKNADNELNKLTGNIEEQALSEIALQFGDIEKELVKLEEQTNRIIASPDIYSEEEIQNAKNFQEQIEKINEQIRVRESLAKLSGLEAEGQNLQLRVGLGAATEDDLIKNLEDQLKIVNEEFGVGSTKALELLTAITQLKEGLFQEDLEQNEFLFGIGQLSDEDYIAGLTENLEMVREKFGETSIEFLVAQENLKKVQEELDTVLQLGLFVAEGLAQGLGQAFVDALNGAESFEDGFKNVLRNIAQQIVQATIQALIFAAILSSLGLGGGQSFGQLFEGSFSSSLGLPTRHNGGEVGRSGDSGNSTKNINMLNPSSSLNPNERLIVARTDESVVKTSSLESNTGVGSKEVMQPQVSVNNFVTDDVLKTFLESDSGRDGIINVINNNQDRLI